MLCGSEQSMNFERTANLLKIAATADPDGEHLDIPSDPSNLLDELIVAFGNLVQAPEKNVDSLTQCVRCMANACAVYELKARQRLSPIIDKIASAKLLEIPQLWMVSVAFIINLCVDYRNIHNF
jgi:hypothetical protein